MEQRRRRTGVGCGQGEEVEVRGEKQEGWRPRRGDDVGRWVGGAVTVEGRESAVMAQ